MEGGSNEQQKNKLSDASEQLLAEGAPLRQGIQGMGMDILKTGGTQSMLPFIQQMIQNMRTSLSQTMTDTQGRLGRQASSPFGQRLMAQTQLQGQSGIAQAGPNASMQMLSSLIPYSQGQTQTAIGGLGSASQSGATEAASQNDMYAKVLTAMMGGAEAMGAAMCWVAEALYGPQAVETWLARWWVMFEAPEWVRTIYRRYGRQVARSRYVWMLRPLFNRIVRHARREFYR